MTKVVLQVVADEFAVCQLPPSEPVPAWAGSTVFTSVTRTPDEVSVVCPAGQVPAGVKAVSGWRMLKIAGPLDFGAVGVLHSVAGPLAGAGISLLTIGTYDTDYVMVKAGQLADALRALEAAGHTVRRD